MAISDDLILQGIADSADRIADLQEKLDSERITRDDQIRDALARGLTKVSVARAADLSVEQIRLIEFNRYSRESRRKKRRNPGPERD